jgi:hypothetical protein
MRAKKCKVCRESFQPTKPMQVACSLDCALKLARRKREKDAEKEVRARKESLKSLSDYTKEAQAAFNAYIRERDKDKPCICCNGASSLRNSRGGDWDCGHYRSTGAAPHLRFHEDNAHRQRKYCNQYLSGNAVEYRKGLIARIGLERVEALENDNHTHKWTRDELIAIRDKYRAKLRELKKGAY